MFNGLQTLLLQRHLVSVSETVPNVGLNAAALPKIADHFLKRWAQCCCTS